MDALGEFLDLSRVLAVMSGLANHRSQGGGGGPLPSWTHPPPRVTLSPCAPSRLLGTLSSLLGRKMVGRPWPGVWLPDCGSSRSPPPPTTAPELLPSAPLQCDSNPLETAANSAESSDL